MGGKNKESALMDALRSGDRSAALKLLGVKSSSSSSSSTHLLMRHKSFFHQSSAAAASSSSSSSSAEPLTSKSRHIPRSFVRFLCLFVRSFVAVLSCPGPFHTNFFRFSFESRDSLRVHARHKKRMMQLSPPQQQQQQQQQKFIRTCRSSIINRTLLRRAHTRTLIHILNRVREAEKRWTKLMLQATRS